MAIVTANKVVRIINYQTKWVRPGAYAPICSMCALVMISPLCWQLYLALYSLLKTRRKVALISTI